MVEKANCARSRGSRETAEKQGKRKEKSCPQRDSFCVVTLSGFEPELPP